MTNEIKSLQLKVEGHDREKMTEVVKQKAIQKDEEIANLKKEHENLTIQVCLISFHPLLLGSPFLHVHS